MIGHAVGFDLAVLKRECERAGLPWSRPRTLDTRLLAEIAAPEPRRLLARQARSLARGRDHGPSLGPRRRGDHGAHIPGAGAEAARAGIRTVGRGRAGLPCAHRRARRAASRRLGRGGERPPRVDAERTLRRIDSYRLPPSRPRRHARAGELRRRRTLRLGDALALMASEKISSLLCGARTAPARRRSRRPTPASSPSATCCARSAELGADALELAGRPDHEQAAGLRFPPTPSSIAPSAA